MKRLIAFLLIAVVEVTNAVATDASMLPPDLAVAMRKAEETKRKVLIEFFSYNSVESKMVRDNVLANPQVAAVLAEQVILVSVEQEKEKDLCQRYGISRAPALVLIKPDGSEIDRLLGNRAPEELVRLLQGRGGDHASVSDLAAKAARPDAGVEAHLALADAYGRIGKADQALDELTVCLDRASVPGPDRKYFKSVLTRMATLATQQPQAKSALQTRRDALEKEPALRSDGVQVLFALNDALKEQTRNVDYFLKLSADSALRRQLFPLVFVQLVEAKRYAEAAGAVDLEAYVNSAYPNLHAGHDHAGNGHDEATHERREKLARERMINLTTAAVQTLLATDQLEKAKRITGRLLETYDGNDTRSLLGQAAQRSAAKRVGDYNAWLQATYPEKPEAKQTRSAQ